MEIITHTGQHIVMSAKCSHPECWPDGFCIVCAVVEEARRKDKLNELRLKASLDDRVLELFPSVRFIQCGRFYVKAEDGE